MATWRERGYVQDSDSDDDGDCWEDRSLPDRENRPSQTGGQSPPGRAVTDSLLTPVGAALDTAPHHASLNTFSGRVSKQRNGINDSRAQSHVVVLVQEGGPSVAPDGGHEAAAEPIGRVPLESKTSAEDTAHRLEVEINTGLQTIHDVLNAAPNFGDDESDSPLSSPPSSIQSSPRAASTGSLLRVSLSGTATPRDLWAAQASRPGRLFRPRAPIQLHPYALEDARYRQSWKDRGLQPVRLPAIASDAQTATGDDSQGVDVDSSTQMDLSDDQQIRSHQESLVEDESQSPIRSSRIHAAVPEISLEDDFPELSEILHAAATQSVQPAAKTPRTAGRQSKPPPRKYPDAYQIYDLPDDEPPVESNGQPTRTTFVVPPSPPRSGGAMSPSPPHFHRTSTDHVAGRSSHENISGLLPSPLLSSDKPSTKRSIVEVLSSSASEASEPSHGSDFSSSEASDEESQGVQRLRRKIKGVLPASWLKIDHKRQETKNRARNRQRSPANLALERGVAQRVSAVNSNAINYADDQSRARMDLDDLHSSSGSDAEILLPTTVNDDDVEILHGPYHDNDVELRHGPFDEAVEDNAIDAMLPPRPRSSGVPRRQRCLQESWSRLRPHETTGTGSLMRDQRNGPRTSASRHKRGPRPLKKTKRIHNPRVTVLDAPGLAAKDVPRFLRIAIRQKPGRTSRADQIVSQKFFKLATAQDTRDVNQELDRYRKGRVQTRARPLGDGAVSLNGPPHILHDKQRDNDASSPGHEHSGLSALKQSTRATLEKLQTRHVAAHALPREGFVSRKKHADILLDYFDRPPTRTIATSSRRAQGACFRAARPHVTSLSSSTPLPISKREPKPPAARRQVSASDEVLSASVTQIFPRQKRMKRKQRPRLLDRDPGFDMMLGQEETSFAAVADDLTDLIVEEDDDLVQVVLEHQPDHKCLEKNMDSRCALVRPGGLLEKTLTSMRDPCDRLVECGLATFATFTDNVANSLAETATILGETTRFEESGSRSLRCIEKLEGLVRFCNETLTFHTREDTKAFVASALDEVDKLLNSISIHRDAVSEPAVSCLLRILGVLMLFGFQLDGISKIAGSSLSTRNLESRRRVATLAFGLALRRNTTGPLFCWLAVDPVHDLGSMPSRALPSPEIESLVLIHVLCPGQPWTVYLEDHLTLQRQEGGRAADRLSYIILILGWASLLGSDSLSVPSSPDDRLVKPACLTVLSNALNEFLKSVTRKAQQFERLDHFGLVALQWSLLLMRRMPGQAPDHVVKQMFKHYSDRNNNMLDFFSGINTTMPDFLRRQQAPDELVPEPRDTDFHLFLKMVARTLAMPRGANELNSATIQKLEQRKLSLAFSLLPNNGREQGEGHSISVTESEPLTMRDLGAMANRYALLATLYVYSPFGAKPNLSKIRHFIDFGQTHDAVCNLALNCWAAISNSAILTAATRPTVSPQPLQELASWIQEMMVQVTDKLKAVGRDLSAHTDGDNRDVHGQNRNTALRQLSRVADVYAQTIDLCPLGWIAGALVRGERFDDLLVLCHGDSQLDDEAVAFIFQVLAAYFRKGAGSLDDHDVRQRLRPIMASRLSRDGMAVEALLTSMVDAWFQDGCGRVKSEDVNWIDYISDWGYSSFSRIAGTEAARHCQVLLVSRILAVTPLTDTGFYDVFELWLRSLSMAPSEIKFEHCLTNQFLRQASEALGVEELYTRLARGAPRLSLTREDLLEHRSQILRLVIRGIYQLQHRYHCSRPHGLTNVSAERLLWVVTTSLKASWTRLRPGEAKGQYAAFVFDVIFHLSKYTFPHFKIDSWFQEPFDMHFEEKRFHLERFFIPRDTGFHSTDQENAAERLRHACQLACISSREEALVEHLTTTFAADVVDFIDDDGHYMLSIPQQLAFLKGVWPAYIERALDESTPTLLLARPVVAAALAICNRTHTRMDHDDEDHMEMFAETLMAFVAAVVRALQTRPCTFHEALGWEMMALANLVRLCAIACGRWAELQLSFPDSERLLDLQGYVQISALYVHDYACSGLGGPRRPSVPTGWEPDRDSHERPADDFGFDLTEPGVLNDPATAVLRAFAADDLESTGRNDWTRSRHDSEGPGWQFQRVGFEDTPIRCDCADRADAVRELSDAVHGLESTLARLGLHDIGEWEWEWERD